MLILGLDLATNTGFCLGAAGGKPQRSGTARLKRPDDDVGTSGRNLGCLIRDLCAFGRPDLIVVEAPMHAAAKSEKGNGFFSVETAWLLVGAVYGFAGPQGIPVREANVQTVRKHFTGRARHGCRDDAKRAVITRCHQLGLMPRARKNDNEADAIAVWDWACATFARSASVPRELVMFGGTP